MAWEDTWVSEFRDQHSAHAVYANDMKEEEPSMTWEPDLLTGKLLVPKTTDGEIPGRLSPRSRITSSWKRCITEHSDGDK